jgi:cysteine-rich repeat protein
MTVIATAADPDADGLADNIDNCQDVANGDQRDTDGDGIGDACDRETCGNGVQEYDESCDDGNQVSADGCSALCVIEGVTPACSNGRDDDGDGQTDFPADAGCTDANDGSERGSASCDDDIDNDGDYGVDVGGDIACASIFGWVETAKCKDGLDNDGDGFVDFDGGLHAHGKALTAADPHCTTPGINNEKPPQSCGLGAELAPLLLFFGWVWRRRNRSGAREL